MFFDSVMIEEIRNEFPLAGVDPWGNPRIFMDNGAGTLVLKRSADAQCASTLDWSANAGDSFPESRQSSKVIRDGLQAAADLLNAESPDTIISGQTATSLMFELSYALGREMNSHHNIVSTSYEHLSNIDPWRELVRRGTVRELRLARLRPDGALDMDHLRSLVDENTKVVAVSAASNLLGSKTPLAEVTKIARDAGAYSVIDAVHDAAHSPLDVQSAGCDFMVISAYKFFSPKYISYMYGKREHLENLEPYIAGKEHGDLHGKWHWGTVDQSKHAAVTATIDYLAWLGGRVADRYEGRFTEFKGRARLLKISLDAIQTYEKELSLAVMTGVDGIPGLLELPNVRRYGIYDPKRITERDPTFAFSMDNLIHRDAERILVEEHHIAMRSILFWSMAEDFLDIRMPLRASLVHYNTLEEVELFLKAVKDMGERRNVSRG